MASRLKGMSMYSNLQSAYVYKNDFNPERREDFFVSYAVRGPSFVQQFDASYNKLPPNPDWENRIEGSNTVLGDDNRSGGVM